MVRRGEMLWYSAFLLTTVFTVAIAYADIFYGIVFWLVMTLMLIPLRPQ